MAKTKATRETDQATKVSEKLTLRLGPDARMNLEWLAAKRGVTFNEIIRRAIIGEKFLIQEAERGSTFLIEEKGGRIKQLVFL